MQPPFTVEQFLDSFARYNESVWPAQIVFYLAAALLLTLALRPSPRSSRWMCGLLAVLWAWMGVVYHWGFFASINTAAYLFGGVFLLQATLFVVAAARDRLSFRFHADGYGMIGAVMIAYALVAYPIIGALAGHAYARGATFGLPCPTTIATFGVLLWVRGRVPVWLLVIPAAWSLFGFSAAFQLGIIEDYGLLVSGLVGTLAILRKNRRWREPALRVFPATVKVDGEARAPHVLIAYASSHGQTRKIATYIAELLSSRGREVTLGDVRALPAAFELRKFDVVLVGGSIMYGRHQRCLRRFVRAHLDQLNAMPSAFFSVSGSAASARAESRSTARRFVTEFMSETGWHPALTKTVAGATAYTKYNPVMRRMMRRISAQGGGPTDTSRDHEFTDWAQVGRLAERVAELVTDPREARQPAMV